MAFEPKTEAFASSVSSVTIGTGEKTLTLGGNRTLPFYTFDAPCENAPKIGIEIPDRGIEAFAQSGLKAFYDGCKTPAEMAKRAETLVQVSFICLNLESADPNGEIRSAEDCAVLAKQVSESTQLPLVILGCKHVEKDAEIFAKIAELLQGKNILLLSAREENYKNIGASVGLAYAQKLGAESSVDINLAKQLNVMLTQLGVPSSSIVMNAGSAAAGYGFEYLASTLDRIRLAALGQSDDQLQMPIITPVSTECWSVKEATAPECDIPEWGDAQERGIHMEIATASACLAGGSDAVILRHPSAIETVGEMIAALV